MRFQMEQRHLADGEPLRCASCPVALLLNETTGKPGWRAGTWEIWHESAVPHIRTPEIVQQFIVAFDQGKRIDPISFELPDDFINAVLAEVPA